MSKIISNQTLWTRQIALPFLGAGPKHWLHRSMYGDEDFFFLNQEGGLLLAATSQNIPGRRILGVLPTSAGAEVLLSLWDTERQCYLASVGFSYPNSSGLLSTEAVCHALTGSEGQVAGETRWNGSTAYVHGPDGEKIGSVAVPNPLKRELRISGGGGQILSTVRVCKQAEVQEFISAGVKAITGDGQTVVGTCLEFSREDSEFMDVRLVAACLQVILLLN